MSNLADGIEEGGAAPDESVNSQSGFDAALAELAGAELPEGYKPSEGFSLSEGLSTEEPAAPNRDPETGQFVSPATPAEEQATPPAGEEEAAPQPLHEDADIAAFLEKYDGDAEKALKAAAELASFSGRQSNEIGELRSQLAKLEGRFEERDSRTTQQDDHYPVVTEDVLEQIEDDIAKRGGATVMANVVENYPHLIDQTLNLWLETRDPEANAYQARYEAYKVLQEFGQPDAQSAPAQADPYLEQVKQERMAADAANAVFAHIPAEQRDALKPHISAALSDLPEDIAAGLFDPAKREAYSKVVADVARSRFATEASTAATNDARETTNAAKAAAARVATGSLRPAQTPEGEGDTPSREEITQRFHKALLETPTASISEGLTFGK